MDDNKTQDWILGMYFVRWFINTTPTTATSFAPYRLVYGQVPRLGISSLPMSKELLKDLRTEEELCEYMGVSDLEDSRNWKCFIDCLEEDRHVAWPDKQGEGEGAAASATPIITVPKPKGTSRPTQLAREYRGIDPNVAGKATPGPNPPQEAGKAPFKEGDTVEFVQNVTTIKSVNGEATMEKVNVIKGNRGVAVECGYHPQQEEWYCVLDLSEPISEEQYSGGELPRVSAWADELEKAFNKDDKVRLVDASGTKGVLGSWSHYDARGTVIKVIECVDKSKNKSHHYMVDLDNSSCSRGFITGII
jgi:hypothetical protein